MPDQPPNWVPPGQPQQPDPRRPVYPPPGQAPPPQPPPQPPQHPPPQPPPGYPLASGQPPPYPSYAAGGWAPPVHKPGVVALRPLSLGDFFDGAFKTIRRNPKAMVGLAALVTTSFLVIPILVTLGLAASGGLSMDFTSQSAAFEDVTFLLLTYVGAFLGLFATVVLTGMIVHVVAQAVLGKRSTIGEAWAAARPRLLRLIGLTLLNFLAAVGALGVPVVLAVIIGVTTEPVVGWLFGVPLVLAGICLTMFIQFRYFQLAAPALVLERIGVFASLARAGQLSRSQFWRILGIALLTGLVAGLAGQVIGIPFGVLGAMAPFIIENPTATALIFVFSSYLSQIIIGTVTTPFTAAVVALQYVDQRIRKEGLDVSLIAASQRSSPDLR